MQYISNTPKDRAEILKTIGVRDFEDLIQDIPKSLRLRDLHLAEGMSEMELLNEMRKKGQRNVHGGRYASFMGAGLYDHYIPPLVNDLAMRGEFITAYTPYQGEASQGTLQSIYEFQSLICLLTQMDVANASMYDGASSLAEAALMVLRQSDKNRLLLCGEIHPESIQTMKTYLSNIDAVMEVVPSKNGLLDMEAYEKALEKDAALVIFQNPNFLGYIEEAALITQKAKDRGIPVAASVNSLSLSVLTPPGALGVDIVVGEGQPLGNPIAYGGPHFGFFAATREYVRRIPGRLCGMTEDLDGKRAYVLTLQAREQHIRREKATSNICTNHALCALKATIFLATLGPQGFRKMGELNVERSHEALDRLARLPGVESYSDAAFFNEFTLKIPVSPLRLSKSCLKRNLVAPFDLERMNRKWKGLYLVAVTEQRTGGEIARLAEAIQEVL